MEFEDNFSIIMEYFVLNSVTKVALINNTLHLKYVVSKFKHTAPNKDGTGSFSSFHYHNFFIKMGHFVVFT